MKKNICILIFFLLLFSLGNSFANSNDEWVESSDKMIEVAILNLDEATYPTYDVNFKFRLDGVKESAVFFVTLDFTDQVNAFIDGNPAYKNRKLSVTLDHIATDFDIYEGIKYRFTINFTIQNKVGVSKGVMIDLAEVFPEDFVDYDIVNAMACMKKYKGLLLKPESISLVEAYKIESKEYSNIIEYYLFQVTGENKMGGTTASFVFAEYNTYKDKIRLIELDNITTNASDDSLKFSGAKQIFGDSAAVDTIYGFAKDAKVSTMMSLDCDQILKGL